ncbi:helicase [Pseudomonas aeruginosa]|nr:helicase [Pseudomonas aeruginosa]
MSFIRSCISRSVFLLGAGVAVAAQAEVRIDGPSNMACSKAATRISSPANGY